MTDEPEQIWAVTEPDDISAQILGEVYAQQTPDGMVGKPVKYVRADTTYTAADLEAVARAALGAAEEAVRLWGDHRVIRAISAADIVDDYTRGKNDD